MKTFSSCWTSILGATFLLLASLSCSQVKFEAKSNVRVLDTYSWSTDDGNVCATCSKPCGGGILLQNVLCKRSDGVTVEESFCAETGPKPSGSVACNVQACTSTYTWNVSSCWGTCSRTCGGGTQTRTVLCQTDSGQTVADAYCTAPKPAVTQSCNNDSCPPQYTYGWQHNPNQCSASCGGGLEKYTCVRNDNTTVADSFCTDPKPELPCNTQSCSTQYTYDWQAGGWSSCSKSCGGGVRTRDVICKRSDGVTMADVYCQGKTQPIAQEVCNTQQCPNTGRDVTTRMTLPLPAVDVIMIVDDSNSMGPDNTKLAQKMGGFMNELAAANVDYQVCITTTDVDNYAGSPLRWGYYSSGSNFTLISHIINNSTANKAKVVTDTIKFLGAQWNSDEQGIKALNLMVRDFNWAGCIRPRATLTAILISDEDERSVGGDPSRSTVQYKPLTAMNYPDDLIARVASTYNSANYVKPFIWNSIIVRPNDFACEEAQDRQGSPSFFGTLYNELSQKTGGHVASICANDYGQDLTIMKNRVVHTMPYVTLECVPTGNPTITYSPNRNPTVTMDGNIVRFSPALPEGTTVTVNYRCPN